jgi:regulator of replication initiation timing
LADQLQKVNFDFAQCKAQLEDEADKLRDIATQRGCQLRDLKTQLDLEKAKTRGLEEAVAVLNEEIRDLKESTDSTVPDVQQLVIEGPQLTARMNADRADRDASEKVKFEKRQAHVNRVTILYRLIIIKLIICRYCPILLTWSLYRNSI